MSDSGELTFGSLLKRLRTAQHLSQEELAERARMSVAAISALERGSRQAPYRSSVNLLAEGLGVDGDARHQLHTLAERWRKSRALPTRGPTSERPANNLPLRLTSMVGRTRERAETERLLRTHRLVTLTGTGGIGKTRLALQVGADLLERYSDGVWFVDLAPISDPKLVSSVIAKALGIEQQADRWADESIASWLKRKNLLLVFDNCEHVLEPVASIAASILRAAADVCILATSRQAFNIAGEAVHRLPSLSTDDAVTLFVDRATANDASFALSEETAPIVAEICRRLDGIPLAIELAAARVKVLSIPHLAQRLNERFEILTGGSSDALPRQKTLRALLDWSYDLLTPEEQLLFARLGIFTGGFGLDAATNVCGGGGLGEIDILNLLGSLSDKSLVVVDTSGEQERYRLLESTAAYALEKLSASGERDTLARRHAEYFRDGALAADERYGSGSTSAWLSDVELELGNHRTALVWALTQGNDAVVGAAIAGALHRLWTNASLAVEGRYWIGLALERVSEAEQPQIAARLWLALSYLSSGNRSYEAAEHSLQLYRSQGDVRGAARAQTSVAFSLYFLDRFEEAGVASEQALAAWYELGDEYETALSLVIRAAIEETRGQYRLGRELYTRALATFRSLGDRGGEGIALINLAELESADGHPDEALRLVNEALEIVSREKNASYIATALSNRAGYRIALGDLDGARESESEGLRFARQAQNERLLVSSLERMALLAALRGNEQHAARLLGYVDSELSRTQQTPERGVDDKLRAALREALSADEIRSLEAEGAGWSEDHAVEEALLV